MSLLDLDNNIDKIWSETISYFNENMSTDADLLWASEQILTLFSKWSTGITQAILVQDLCKQCKTGRSQSKVKETSDSKQVLNATIDQMIFNEQGDPILMQLKQGDSKGKISSSIHDPFIQNRTMMMLLTTGRRIHITGLHFAANCLLPSPFTIVDLGRSRSDIDFISQMGYGKRLADFVAGVDLSSIIVRVESETKFGFEVSDDSTEQPVQFVLSSNQRHFRQLLRYKDLLLIVNPIGNSFSNKVRYMQMGPSTAFYRLPMSNDYTLSQSTQYLTQDGLTLRNSPLCRSFNGTVTKITMVYTSDVLHELQFEILGKSGQNCTLFVYLDEIDSDTKHALLDCRVSHFVYLFGLKGQSIEDPTNLDYEFTDESTFFDTSLMLGVFTSDVIQPHPLSQILSYDTFVCRATIVSTTVRPDKVHNECGTVLNGFKCPYCGLNRIGSMDGRSTLVLNLWLDDGTCPPVKVVGLVTKFPFWGVSTIEWRDGNDVEHERMQMRLIGQEFMFALSKGRGSEFGEKEETVWRVDLCTKPVGDSERSVIHMLDQLKKE